MESSGDNTTIKEKSQQNGSHEILKTKNLYEDARSCAVKIICRCERTDSYLDKLIDAELRNSNLNDFDKSLLNELAHGVIRWMRRLDWFLNGFYRGNYEKCMPEVKNALRVALYQIMFLNKIPYSAAVNEAVEYVKRIHGEKHAAVVNGLLRNIIRTLDNLVWPSREIDEVNYLGMVQSHPNWMVRRWVNRFGFDDAEKLCEANNKRPVISLRVNRLKLSNEDFEQHLFNRNIQFRKSEFLENFYTIRTMAKIYTDDFFEAGMFTVQDVSAGLVSHLVAPSEDEVVLDVCAAPGGKSSHLSELMNNRGKLVSVEKYLSRAEIMKRNFERLGVENSTVVHDDIKSPESDLLKEELVGKVDKLLLDVPCSGLGVLSKKPDIKWKREIEHITELQSIQLEILENSVKYLKPNGVMVYSTCTTEKEENEDVINLFLVNHPEFEIENASNYVTPEVVNSRGFIEIFPHIHSTDGSFAARFKRKGI